MASGFDLLVLNGTCVTPGGVARADVAVHDGRISEIGDLSTYSARDVIDASGLHILPGVIDAQVHCREPGFEHKETLEAGNIGAVLGGVTTMLEMSNTNPATTSEETLRQKLDLAMPVARCNIGFSIGATRENIRDLHRLERLSGVCAIELFMGSATGGLMLSEEPLIEQAMRNGSRRIAVHCIDEDRVVDRQSLTGDDGDVTRHPVWRDETTSLNGVKRAIALAHKTGRRMHVMGISSREEAGYLKDHKDICTVEVTPHHLTLMAPDCYERLGTFAQMNPPIRSKTHLLALWDAVQSGLVDVVGTDHAPHTRKEKAEKYPASPSGLPGLQTMLPTMLDHVNAGRLSIERLADITSAGPARAYGMVGKGRIAVGYHGDLTIVDLKSRRTIEKKWIANRSGWSPYEGITVTGWPIATIVNGHIAMRDDELVGEPMGKLVKFAA